MLYHIFFFSDYFKSLSRSALRVSFYLKSKENPSEIPGGPLIMFHFIKSIFQFNFFKLIHPFRLR